MMRKGTGVRLKFTWLSYLKMVYELKKLYTVMGNVMGLNLIALFQLINLTN